MNSEVSLCWSVLPPDSLPSAGLHPISLVDSKGTLYTTAVRGDQRLTSEGCGRGPFNFVGEAAGDLDLLRHARVAWQTHSPRCRRRVLGTSRTPPCRRWAARGLPGPARRTTTGAQDSRSPRPSLGSSAGARRQSPRSAPEHLPPRAPGTRRERPRSQSPSRAPLLRCTHHRWLRIRRCRANCFMSCICSPTWWPRTAALDKGYSEQNGVRCFRRPAATATWVWRGEQRQAVGIWKRCSLARLGAQVRALGIGYRGPPRQTCEHASRSGAWLFAFGWWRDARLCSGSESLLDAAWLHVTSKA